MSTFHNKIFISADFELEYFRRFFRFLANFRQKFFGSKSAEMKISLCKVDMGKKLYVIIFFDLWSKKMELMKQNHLLKIGFLIFLKGATFSDSIDYIPSGIQIQFPLF